MPATTTSIRFVESTDTYSVYARSDGSEVYLAHGFPRVYLVEYDFDWVMEQWRLSPLRGRQFLYWLRERLLDPDYVDDLRVCEDCDEPVHVDDGRAVEGDGFACDSCVHDDYYPCTDCATYTREPNSTLHDGSVCDGCRDNGYSWCDDCDGYYHDSYADDHHDHASDCDCESPVTRFAIRNDGYGMLWNDHQVTVSLPAGVLDEEGIYRIWRYLRDQELYTAASVLDSLDRRWQTKDGNFTKRLSRAAYKLDGSKIPPEVLSQVGCIARDHSRSVDFIVATTRELNMSASDFYHEGSCWWQSYDSSRCSLKSNGGFGLRSFSAGGYVSGRAWVMPLVKNDLGDLRPTFNTETPDAFVVFNCYGNLEGYNAARIVSHMAGMTYRKIDFGCEPMYINGDSAYLIAPEEIATDYTDGSLYLFPDVHSDLYYRESRVRELVNA